MRGEGGGGRGGGGEGGGGEGGGGGGEVILRSRRNIWRTETRVRGER